MKYYVKEVRTIQHGTAYLKGQLIVTTEWRQVVISVIDPFISSHIKDRPWTIPRIPVAFGVRDPSSTPESAQVSRQNRNNTKQPDIRLFTLANEAVVSTFDGVFSPIVGLH